MCFTKKRGKEGKSVSENRKFFFEHRERFDGGEIGERNFSRCVLDFMLCLLSPHSLVR